MTVDAEALVIGGGPAGASAAILLAKAGWRVVLVEQHAYPRQKVCGECVAAGNLPLMDELGIGPEFRRMAGAPLREVGWMSARATIVGDFPRAAGPDGFGRALGRDKLDSLLLERARALDVRILQPAKVRTAVGDAGRFECRIEKRDSTVDGAPNAPEHNTIIISAAIIIDAHGSWEAAPSFAQQSRGCGLRASRRDSDLFAFKASFLGSTLAPGLLPVFSFEGGYGGIVVGDGRRTTLACCIRRDVLKSCRALTSHATAGLAVEAMLRGSCPGLRDVLRDAQRDNPWLSVGPIRPGIRLDAPSGVFRVGNAAGESHPLIGEGMSMALQSAAMLVRHLTLEPAGAIDARRASLLQYRYAHAWKKAFAPRLRLAALYAQLAMRPALAVPVGGVLRRWPTLLTQAARLAGKARHPINPLKVSEESV